MEAARVCALRGHKVSLMEKRAGLGGTVATLALDPLAAEFGNIVNYLGVQMRKLKIEVRVCHEAGQVDIDTLDPEVVILATGAFLVIPKVVENRPGVIDQLQALRARSQVGQEVVIWGLVYGA